MFRTAALLSIALPLLALGQATQPVSTQPVSTQPAASRPARNIGRYYNLIKNEFMKSEDGQIMVCPSDVKHAIEEIRRSAADEKRSLDEQIASLTRDINAADAQRKNHEAQARASAKEAKENERKSKTVTWQNNRVGGISNVQTHVDSSKVSAAKYHRGQQDAGKAAAREAQGDVNWNRAELIRLKKESAALASVASAYSRNLPPETYWRELPEDMQDQLSHVGISLDEFKGLIKSCKLTEDQFLDAAFRIDKRTKTADELANGLLDFLRDRIPPVKKTEPAKKTQS